jgi:hypothetical protein
LNAPYDRRHNLRITMGFLEFFRRSHKVEIVDPGEQLTRQYIEHMDMVRSMVTKMGPWNSIKFLAETLQQYTEDVAEHQVLLTLEKLRLEMWRIDQEAIPSDPVASVRIAIARLEALCDANPFPVVGPAPTTSPQTPHGNR